MTVDGVIEENMQKYDIVVVHAIYNILSGFFGGTDYVKLQE